MKNFNINKLILIILPVLMYTACNHGRLHRMKNYVDGLITETPNLGDDGGEDKKVYISTIYTIAIDESLEEEYVKINRKCLEVAGFVPKESLFGFENEDVKGRRIFVCNKTKFDCNKRRYVKLVSIANMIAKGEGKQEIVKDLGLSKDFGCGFVLFNKNRILCKMRKFEELFNYSAQERHGDEIVKELARKNYLKDGLRKYESEVKSPDQYVRCFKCLFW